MRIPLDRQSGVPLYRQIADFLRRSILAGNQSPAARLPASRRLAADLGVNRATVEAAYAELEADGLVFTRAGSGTYVLPADPLPPSPKGDPPASWPPWQREAETENAAAKETAPEDLLRQSHHPSPISFAGGAGDPRLFPAAEFLRIVRTVVRRDGIDALSYGERRGYAPLRAAVARILADDGLAILPENILITSGSQQALALVAQLLLKPGDTVAVESPTYPAALALFQTLGLRVAGVPVDVQGMQLEKLEELIQERRPKLVYTMPNFQNPTGVCLSSQRRRRLIALADRANIPILEDDFVGDLRYEGHALPPLKALDPGGRVIYISTFSKMLLPGLRVGFLAAEGPVHERLVNAKYLFDLATSSLFQRALESLVNVGRYRSYLRRACLIYRRRRDAMLAAIRRHLPAGVCLDPPQGGLFIWLRLPGGLSAEELLPAACAEGVAFAPGGGFFPDGPGDPCFLRLNFAAQPPEEIEEGMARLGRAIARLTARRV